MLAATYGREIKLTAAGRTDAGVHATGQVVSFDCDDRIPQDKLALAFNASLPPDLSVRSVEYVHDGFSARFDALERFYTYVVFNRREPSAVLRRSAYHDYHVLDLERMRSAANELCGTHDFRSFCGMAPESGSYQRTVHSVTVERRDDLVLFRFAGAGFLHRMVRISVGTLLEIGSGRRTEPIAQTLAARDRRAAGLTAPPQGLYLTGVRYADFCSLAAESRGDRTNGSAGQASPLTIFR